jgi:serine/threonine-protein kinase
MSPEQARGSVDADCRSDLWSLAVVTYHCLTGQLPFSGASIPELLAHVAFGPAPMPSVVAPCLPSNFDRWWCQATARSIEERFQSASELADSLIEALTPAETGRKDSGRSYPAVEAAFERRETPFYRRPKPPMKGVRALSAAGLLSALVAILIAAGHSHAYMAWANLSGRSVAAVASPRLAPAAPPQFAVDVLAPPVDSTPAASDLPKHSVKREQPRLPAARPPRVVVYPQTDAVPKTEEAAVDFGI